MGTCLPHGRSYISRTLGVGVIARRHEGRGVLRIGHRSPTPIHLTPNEVRKFHCGTGQLPCIGPAHMRQVAPTQAAAETPGGRPLRAGASCTGIGNPQCLPIEEELLKLGKETSEDKCGWLDVEGAP